MFVVLLLSAVVIGAIAFGLYAHGHGKLGLCALGALLLLNPITGPVCWPVLVVVALGTLLKRSGVADWWAGSDGSRL